MYLEAIQSITENFTGSVSLKNFWKLKVIQSFAICLVLSAVVTGIPDLELYTQRSYSAPVDIPSLCLKPMQYLPENQKIKNTGHQMEKNIGDKVLMMKK